MPVEKPIMLTARVSEGDLTALERIARTYGLNRSEALRRAIWTTVSDRNLAPAGDGPQMEVMEHEPG